MNKKDLKKAISALLKSAGFTKKGQTWYFDGKEVLIVANLQKSNWSDLYDINIGFWLKGLGEAVFPAINHCHLYYRVENLLPDNGELMPISLQPENSDTDKLEAITQYMASQVIPFLLACTNEQKLRELMTLGKLNNGIILAEARRYLSEKAK